MVIKKTAGKLELKNKKTHLLSLLALVLLFFYLLIVFTHRFWLPIVADLLVIDNQPRKADLIVVSSVFRPRFLYALKLLKKGYADQILLVGDTRIKALWSKKTSLDLAQSEAIMRGIPESKVHVKHSTGTRADAAQAKLLMTSLGLRSTLIISDPYNMLRLNMIFNHIFKGSGLELTLVPTNEHRESPDYWWRSPRSFVYVIKEWIKIPMNYYLLNYRPQLESEIVERPKDNLDEDFTEPKIKLDSLFSKEFPKNLFRLIKFKIGEFLVVDKKEVDSETIITPILTSRISLCYRESICKKIFLFNGVSNYTQNSIETEQIQKANNNKAKELGINPDDVKMVPHGIGYAYQTAHFLNQFMRDNNLKSVNFYLPYYGTRSFQFYFKRFLNPDFTVHIKPLESKYRHFLDQWLQNTGLGNLFLDQYLIMAHYYFNKFLWSSRA